MVQEEYGIGGGWLLEGGVALFTYVDVWPGLKYTHSNWDIEYQGHEEIIKRKHLSSHYE